MTLRMELKGKAAFRGDYNHSTFLQEMNEITLSRTRPNLVSRRTRLIESGTLGHWGASGIFNPGAVARGNGFDLLCRGEPNEQTWLGDCFGSKATPILCKVNADLSINEFFALSYESHCNRRPEDWRLFQHHGKLYSNHSSYYMEGDSLRCQPSISAVDIERRALTLCANLTPPFLECPEEKNWSVFSHDDQLLCIYSIEPYIILKIDLENEGKTDLYLESDELILPYHEKGDRYISSSTNVIDWDDSAYILFIHYYLEPFELESRDRIYLQYGMLIDKLTLLPISIIPDPLLVGGEEEGRHSGVHYTMSLVNKPDGLYAFYGEGDSHTGVVVFDKDTLGELFSENKMRTLR